MIRRSGRPVDVLPGNLIVAAAILVDDVAQKRKRFGDRDRAA